MNPWTAAADCLGAYEELRDHVLLEHETEVLVQRFLQLIS